MDSGRVLVALQEQEKWRERRARLGARLRAVQARKRFLQRELEAVRRRVDRVAAVVEGLRDERVPWEGTVARFDR
jgi:predicted GTPase